MKRGIVISNELQALIVERALGEAGVERAGGVQLSKKDLSRVARAVIGLSDHFNRIGEPLRGDYMEKEIYRRAYLLYYMGASFAKAATVLSELLETSAFQGSPPRAPNRQAGRKPLSVLDVGSGPGGTSLGALDVMMRLHEPSGLRFTAMDKSRRALDDYEFFMRARAEAANRRQGSQSDEAEPVKVDISSIETSIETAGFSNGCWDIILLADTLNELFSASADPAASRAAFLMRLAAGLTDEGSLVVIEPSLKATSRSLMALRDTIAAAPDLYIGAGCLTAQPCPMLADARGRDWCHAGAHWMRPAVVRQIDMAAGRKKHILKFSYLVIQRRPAQPVEAPDGMTAFRVVGDLRREKGRCRIMLCGEAGCRTAMLLKRDLRESNKTILNVQRGDIIAMDAWDERNDGWRLGTATRVEILRSFNWTGLSQPH